MPDSFAAETTQWKPENAHACARLSQLAYEDNDDIITEALRTELGFTGYDYIVRKETETEVIVVSDAKAVVVAFRGTEMKIRDWMTDADIAKTGFAAGRVHEGFLWALNSVWDDLVLKIAAQKTQGQSLWFTGHSLGGALATLSVGKMRLEEDHRPVNGLYTFGCPRVGDDEFGHAFDQEFGDCAFRYVNENDVVPRLAPRAFGYTHVGSYRWFDDAGKLHEDIHWWNKLLDTIKVDFEGIFHGEWAPGANHAIARYLEKTSRKAARKLV